jgi:hypothetical protein
VKNKAISEIKRNSNVTPSINHLGGSFKVNKGAILTPASIVIKEQVYESDNQDGDIQSFDSQ